MRIGIVLIVALGIGAVAIVLSLPDDVAPTLVTDSGSSTRGLTALVTRADPACALCHYGWQDVVFVDGSATTANDSTRFDLVLRPTSTFNLTDVRVLDPSGRTYAVPSLLSIESDASASLVAPATGVFDVPSGAGGVNLRVLPADQFARPLLSARLEGPGGLVESTSRASLSLTLNPEGGLAPGLYTWSVTLVDGARPQEALRVKYDIAPVESAQSAFATGESPARVSLVVPGDGARGVILAVRSENHHPVASWLLPNWGDHAEYLLWITPRDNESASPKRAWGALDAYWGGPATSNSRTTIYHERIDAVLVRAQDAHGEWTRRGRYIEPPEEEHAYPPLPPGTDRVEVTLSWGPRTPLSPQAEWFLGYAMATRGPIFYYPDADESGVGVRKYVIDVGEKDWETTLTGGFQALPLMRLVDGHAEFDGWREIVVEAVRGADPAASTATAGEYTRS